MDSWKLDRVGSAIKGENPTVMTRLNGGFAVIGDVQWLPGYSVLITDRIGVDRLSDLPRPERSAFLNSLDILAEAVEIACSQLDPAFLRVNIEILGNKDPFLHAHVWPRYQWEAPEMRSKPVWLYPGTNWSDPATSLNSSHAPYRSAITAHITELATPNAVRQVRR
ncbi:HIT family protein [Arthrobacter stackebrandtii]|nr:diadenosine tetraphosphate hydrolase [Arthrobacter stackebrandtii]